MMGLEEHLLTMFREDFEFNESSVPSHLAGGGDHRQGENTERAAASLELVWDSEAERELKKIPFFVRGKARRNTERFAAERGVSTISLETLYDAKAHFSS